MAGLQCLLLIFIHTSHNPLQTLWSANSLGSLPGSNMPWLAVSIIMLWGEVTEIEEESFCPARFLANYGQSKATTCRMTRRIFRNLAATVGSCESGEQTKKRILLHIFTQLGTAGNCNFGSMRWQKDCGRERTTTKRHLSVKYGQPNQADR